MRDELLPFPDSKLALDHALETLHCAVLIVRTIYISLREENQLEALRLRTNPSGPQSIPSNPHSDDDHNHEHPPFPSIQSILEDTEHHNIGLAAALFAAPACKPTATFLVLGLTYPLLPSSALLQPRF
jgi:hypothetical protein